MTDDDNALAPAEGPDWPRLARELTASGHAYASELADGSPRGAERAALVTAFAAALHRPDPVAPTAAEVERALAAALGRREVVALRASAIERAAGLPWRSRRIAAAAAAVVIAAGGLLVWQRGEDDPSPAQGAVIASARRTVSTAVGKVETIRLADGSRVILGPSTRIDIAAGAANGSREVTLRGQAFFEVVHDASRPFVVRTSRGILRDVGTSFVVHSDAPAGLMVTVRTGAVAVNRTGAPASDEQVIAAGDRAILPDQGSLRIERGTSTDADLTFTRGHLALHDATVADVADAMRRWYGLEFRVTDSALSRRRVTASFDREAGADAARIVAAAMGGSARVSGDTVFVSGPSTSAPRE